MRQPTYLEKGYEEGDIPIIVDHRHLPRAGFLPLKLQPWSTLSAWPEPTVLLDDDGAYILDGGRPLCAYFRWCDLGANLQYARQYINSRLWPGPRIPA